MTWLIVSTLAVVAGTVLVPFAFPPSQAQRGVSTVLGSNNQLAYAWYIVAIFVPGIVLARLLPLPAVAGTPDLAGAWRAVDRRWLGAVVAAHVLIFGALFAYKGRFVFSEGVYFQGLLNRMSLGETPYVDFSYHYGPTMLYPAHWLGQVAGPALGYGIWYVATYVIGLGMLFALIGAFFGGGKRGAILYVAVAVATFNLMTGLNFTLMRYLLPTIAFLLAQDAILRGGRAKWIAAAAVLAFGWLYSFEILLLTAGGVMLVTAVVAARGTVRSGVARLGRIVGLMDGAAPRALEPGPTATLALLRGISLLAVAGAVLVAAFALIDPSLGPLFGYTESARNDLAGAHNTPVYPHIPFIAMYVATVFGIAGVVRIVTRSTVTTAQLALGAFLGMALVAQRPSFSVSDPQHYLFFGLATLLIGLYLTTVFPPVRRTWSWLLAIGFAGLVASVQVYQVSVLLPFVRGGTPQSTPASASVDGTTARRSASAEASLAAIAERVGRDRRYLMYRLDYYSVPVHGRLGLRYASYHTDLNSVTTAEIVDHLIGELKERDAVVIIENSELATGKRAFQRDAIANTLAWITSAPMPGSDLQSVIIDNDSRIQASLLRFLREDSRRLIELDGFIALEPKR